MISNFPAMLRVWTALLELLVCQFIITAVTPLLTSAIRWELMWEPTPGWTLLKACASGRPT